MLKRSPPDPGIVPSSKGVRYNPHLNEAKLILEERFGAKYSIKSVWYLFKVNKIKLKTARPENYKIDKEKQEEFNPDFESF